MLDAHTWWKLGERYGRETVRDLVAHAGEHGACWVEEPVEPDDHEGYVDLAAGARRRSRYWDNGRVPTNYRDTTVIMWTVRFR
jgi:hypothetical protein